MLRANDSPGEKLLMCVSYAWSHITTHFAAMCTPYLFNGVRRSTQAWLPIWCFFSTVFIQYDKLSSSEDNRYILSSFLAYFKPEKRAKLCNQACVGRRTPFSKHGVHIAVKCVVDGYRNDCYVARRYCTLYWRKCPRSRILEYFAK